VELLADGNQLVTVHAEDSGEFECMELEEPEDWARNRRPEAEVEAVKKAIEVADDPIHFCHVSHPDSVEAIADTQHTLEVTPHHLFLSRDDFDEKGTYVKMNPPLRSEEARQRLWKLIDDVDAVATDHAPHTVDEKEEHVGEAPAGVPGVETLVPLMLAKVLEGEITLENFIDLTGRRPAEIFDFRSKGRIEEGLDADLYVTDLDTTKVDGDELHSRAGWTPFEGLDAVFPRLVLRRGETIYDGEVKKSKGKLVS
ncbi:MAG: dihydroorotase, partial [Halobacteria archaeon]